MCLSINTKTVSVINTSLADYSDLIKFQIYPNPNNGLFMIALENNSKDVVLIEIYSVSGKLVYSKQISSNNLKEQLDLSKHKKGDYLIRISSKKFVKTEKFVIN